MNPVFQPATTYGHFGRDSYTREVEVYYSDDSTTTRNIDGKLRYFKDAEFFAWEKLDAVESIKKEFDL
jgi:S-adenosylmethionine synthetase